MTTSLRIITQNFFLIALVGVWFLICLANFKSGTFLSGWDNLHPEFNFSLNVARSLSASWQEYQGAGLVGGMAHAADLPRQLILWIASLFLPNELIRYFWTFAMLLIGPLGIYFLTTKRIFSQQTSTLKNIAGLSASVFYLLNLGTVQTFFTPFDPNVSFYGFLPWLVVAALSFLQIGGKRSLFKFFVVSILAIPSFYVQTYFVVYLVVLTIFSLEIAFKKKLVGVKRLLVLLFIVVLSNSFWLLPVSYFGIARSSVLLKAHGSTLATPEIQTLNQARGSLPDTALIKGFWFDYYDLDDEGKFSYLYEDWIQHAESQTIQVLGYAVFGIALLGIFFRLLSKKNQLVRFSPLILLVVAYFMLATVNPPFGGLFEWVSNKVPLFSQMFRDVFTKWSVPTAFVYSLGIFFFLDAIGGYFKVKLSKSFWTIGFAVLSISASVLVVFPVFSGKLISERMRVDTPDQYFEVFEYFKKLPKEGRVAFLPIHNFWGWNFYSWGYRGSGFLWYGIEQPILDRAFDVWSPYNETFYNEAAFALYDKDLEAFERVLDKYQVKHLLLDGSVISPGGDSEILNIEGTKELIVDSTRIREIKNFGFLTLYETDVDVGTQFVSNPDKYSKVDTELTYSQIDPIFQEDGGAYIQDSEGTSYPFVNLDSRRGPTIEFEGSQLRLRSRPMDFSGQKTLIVPEFEEDVTVTEGNEIEVRLPAGKRISADFSDTEVNNCDFKKKGEVSKLVRASSIAYKAENGGVACDFVVLSNLAHSGGYVLRIKGENKQGRSLKIYLQNWETHRMDLEELLPEGKFDSYYFILPKKTDGVGYTLNLETRAFGRIASENIIERVEIIPVPLESLMQIKLAPENNTEFENNLKILGLSKFGTSDYQVYTKGDGLLVLGQGYDDGWIALTNFQFPFTNFQVLKHAKVNSWANGWLLECQNEDDKCQINIIFWPQILEYLGFMFLIMTFGYFGVSYLKGRR